MKINRLWLVLLATISTSLISSNVCAIKAAEQDFDDIDRMLDLKFKQKTADIDNLYHAYEKAIDDAFKGLTKKIKVEWPDNVKLPTKSTWVGYSGNLQTRSIVDFDEGELVIETIVKNNDLSQAKQAISTMAEQLSATTTEPIEKLDLLSQTLNTNLNEQGINATNKLTPKKNILQKLLPTSGVLDVSNANVSKIDLPTMTIKDQQIASATADLSVDKSPTSELSNSLDKLVEVIPSHNSVNQNAQTTNKQIETALALKSQTNNQSLTKSASIEALASKENVQPSDPQIKLELIEKGNGSVLKMTVKFVNNYQKILLANNFEDVKKFSAQYDVPISVILAIIETESSYNPRAISRVPAFGLMQLVPKTAGVDAHNYVHGNKKVVSPDYLFDETNNLQLGTAYFKLLKSRYLRKIKDPRSRFYCAVSSYNTGVGNLAITFTGQKNLTAAAKKINTMSPDEVYQFLLTNLPAEETRNYLKKIVTRRAKYQHFDNEIKEI